MTTEELESKYIAGYLPYNLKSQLLTDKTEEFEDQEWAELNASNFKKGSIWTLIGINKGEALNIPLGEGYLDGMLFRHGTTYVNFKREILPILHPLSDLTIEKYFEMTGKNKKDDFALYFTKEGLYKQGYTSRLFENCELLPYYHIVELLENHFDIHGLIEKGLAISIHDV